MSRGEIPGGDGAVVAGRVLGTGEQVQRGIFHGASGVVLVGLGLPQAWLGSFGTALGVSVPSLDTVLAGGVLLVLGCAARPIAMLPSAGLGQWLSSRRIQIGWWVKVALAVADFAISVAQAVAAGILVVLVGRFIEWATGRGKWDGDAFVFAIGMTLVGGAFWWVLSGVLGSALRRLQKMV